MSQHGDCRDDCPIVEGGLCARHKCRKTPQLVRLCREKPEYWTLWERGVGPKQRPAGADQLPSKAAEAWNLAKSVKDFVADGCKTVDKEEYQRRMGICALCELKHANADRCLLCGCRLSLKARGRAWKCPDGRWEHPVPFPVVEERAVICGKCNERSSCVVHNGAAYPENISSNAAACPLDQWLASWVPVDESFQVKSRRAVVTVGVGDAFSKVLESTIDSLRAYAEKCGADFIALCDQTQTWGPLEKFRIHRLAKLYDQTLFLDCDVVAHSRATDIFRAFPSGVWMHDDAPYLETTDWIQYERIPVMRTQRVKPHDIDSLYNSGVVLCDRATADVWSPPKYPFRPTHCAEQFLVEHNALRLGVGKLPTWYNTQFWMPEFYNLLQRAEFAHLANCPLALRGWMGQRLARIDGHYS